MATTLQPPNPMSSFADSPHLWLTGHLKRQKQQEHIVKIQAVVKGFLVRKRSRPLKIPQPSSLQELMRHHGLTVWADACPSVKDALLSEKAAKERQECLLHATITLYLLNKGHYVQDLEWADYHERAQASYTVERPIETMWEKFKQMLGL